jgi:hypothetical protein
MNNYKKELIKKELLSATEEEIREIFSTLKYSENYEKILKEEINRINKENEYYENCLKSEVIKSMAYATN